MTVTIVQLTDTHLLAGGTLAYGVVDTGAALDLAVSHIKALPDTIGNIDAVLVTGDVADLGEAAAYERFREALATLDAPVYALPGNHDEREAFRRAFAPDGYLPGEGPLDFEIALGDLLVLGLDSTIPREPGGLIGDNRLAKLDQRLATHCGPAALFLHHPPLDVGIGHMDRQRLADGVALAALATRRPNLRLIACGHVHRTIIAGMGHATVALAPAPAHAVRLDLRSDGPSAFMLEPGGVLVHRFAPDGRVTSYQSFIGVSPGPFPFFPSPDPI